MSSLMNGKPDRFNKIWSVASIRPNKFTELCLRINFDDFGVLTLEIKFNFDTITANGELKDI